MVRADRPGPRRRPDGGGQCPASSLTPHCLRHTYASLLLQAGVSPVYVQRWLGHSSIKLTVDTYGKWLPIGNKGAVDRLDDASRSKMVATKGGVRAGDLEVLDASRDILGGRADGVTTCG
ncbi:MAG: tyrosine-type recombinase/integrase [Candidatus Rokubacteria bacterium]|nr:tyrosine-type recombinase/integrase [Candidatus Rokubacteria bacterium]